MQLIDSLIAFTSDYYQHHQRQGQGQGHYPRSDNNGGGGRKTGPPPVVHQARSPILLHEHGSTALAETAASSAQSAVSDVSPLLASLSSLPLDMILNIPLAISSDPITIRPVYEDIMKRRPNAHAVLYSNLPKQCTNCALRFPNTAESQVQLDAHLDAHFRRNIRMKDKAKKVLARLWMQEEQAWITNAEASDAESSLFSMFSLTSNAGPNANIGDAKVAMLPAGADHAELQCPLCQEPITVVWDDEADDWMYKDAAKDDANRIIHASCLRK